MGRQGQCETGGQFDVSGIICRNISSARQRFKIDVPVQALRFHPNRKCFQEREVFADLLFIYAPASGERYENAVCNLERPNLGNNSMK
jgi:hypothetical protein